MPIECNSNVDEELIQEIDRKLEYRQDGTVWFKEVEVVRREDPRRL